MPAVTLRAHYDGERIILDEPFEIPRNAALMVTVLPATEAVDGEEAISVKNSVVSPEFPQQEAQLLRSPGNDRPSGWYNEHLSLTDFGPRLSRDLCSLSQAANRLRKRAERNAQVAAELERIGEDLTEIQVCQACPLHCTALHTKLARRWELESLELFQKRGKADWRIEIHRMPRSWLKTTGICEIQGLFPL